MAQRKKSLNTSAESHGIDDSIVSVGGEEATNCDLVEINDRIRTFKYELIQEIKKQSNDFQANIENLLLTKKKKSTDSADTKKTRSREKVFKYRESLLTDLFTISHIRTLRHIFISILIILCFQIIIFDLTNHGRVNLDFNLFHWAFTGFVRTMLFIWLPMKLSVILFVYPCLRFYSNKRRLIKSNKFLFDAFFLAVYLTYLVLLILVPLFYIDSIGLACRIIVLMEQVRLLMKTYAFVRSNLPRILFPPPKQSDNDTATSPKPIPFPDFSKFIYFLFAPTAVYRDNYPRTSRPINWNRVTIHFIEVFGCLLYTYCLFDRYCVPMFRSLDIQSLGFVSYVELVSVSVMPGALMQMMVFFAFLHSWHNAWAELLSFGDRQFYLDWWNSTSYNMYYRTWNTLVHDWLYEYIYRDLHQLFGKNYKALAQFGVIIISGLVHEYILSFVFGFFLPVLLILFAGFGFVVMFIPSSGTHSAVWNIFIWTSLFSGLGIQICFFAIEWYARENGQCPRNIETMADYFVPRSMFCLKI